MGTGFDERKIKANSEQADEVIKARLSELPPGVPSEEQPTESMVWESDRRWELPPVPS